MIKLAINRKTGSVVKHLHQHRLPLYIQTILARYPWPNRAFINFTATFRRYFFPATFHRSCFEENLVPRQRVHPQGGREMFRVRDVASRPACTRFPSIFEAESKGESTHEYQISATRMGTLLRIDQVFSIPSRSRRNRCGCIDDREWKK